MNTQEFLDLLQDNPGKRLLFEYGPGTSIDPNYHITEVKNTTIDSVDCGGNATHWKETVVQLWEDPEDWDKLHSLSTDKALSIMQCVDRTHALTRDAVIRFEYGNADFPTAHHHVLSSRIQNDRIVVSLTVNPTQCKAQESCASAVPYAEHEKSCCGGGAC